MSILIHESSNLTFSRKITMLNCCMVFILRLFFVFSCNKAPSRQTSMLLTHLVCSTVSEVLFGMLEGPPPLFYNKKNNLILPPLWSHKPHNYVHFALIQTTLQNAVKSTSEHTTSLSTNIIEFPYHFRNCHQVVA